MRYYGFSSGRDHFRWQCSREQIQLLRPVSSSGTSTKSVRRLRTTKTSKDMAFLLAFSLVVLGCNVSLARLIRRPARLPPVLHKAGSISNVSADELSQLYRHLDLSLDKEAVRAEVPLRNVFTWKNISYAVSREGKQRTILDGISGYLAPRKMCALMGECGVGKVKVLLKTSSRRLG